MKTQKLNGFTLIELLVGMAILSVALGVGFTIVASIIRSSTKSIVFNQVKQNGDLAMEVMVRSIRSGIDVCTQGDDILVYETKVNCVSPPSNVRRTRFRCIEGSGSINGEVRRYEEEGDIIISQNPITTGVRIKAGSCVFTASNTLPKRVSVSFTLLQSFELTSAESQTEIPFKSEVTVRNF